MHHGDEYVDDFTRAAEKSVAYGLLPGVPGRHPDVGRAIDAYELVGRMVNAMPYDALKIRLMCGQIHSELWRWLRNEDVNCLVTIGDIEVDGKREYGTTYDGLEQELSGALRDSDKPYQFHVWLTFPDLHIIDANYFVYKHYDLLPEPWKWSEYVVCSDHPFSARFDTRYVPYLIGDASLVERIIFEEPVAAMRRFEPSPREVADFMGALETPEGPVTPKVGRTVPMWQRQEVQEVPRRVSIA